MVWILVSAFIGAILGFIQSFVVGVWIESWNLGNGVMWGVILGVVSGAAAGVLAVTGVVGPWDLLTPILGPALVGLGTVAAITRGERNAVRALRKERAER